MSTNITIHALDDIFFLDPSGNTSIGTIPLGINIEPSSNSGFYISAEYSFTFNPETVDVRERNFDPQFFANLSLFSKQAGYGLIARWFIPGEILQHVEKKFSGLYIAREYAAFQDRLNRDLLPERHNVVRLPRYR